MHTTSWHTYPSIYALGHKVLTNLLDGDVVVQEKADGSQLSFGYFPETPDFPAGYRARSKGAVLHMDAPEKMFAKACEVIKTLPLHEGWTYRAEYLQRPKHNVLAYNRTPINHLIVFDINTGHEEYLSPSEVHEECERIGLERVPNFFQGHLSSIELFRELLDNESCLGGQKIEGVVIKNYSQYGPDKKCLMGKFVSEAFKEIHAAEWKKENPSRGDIIQQLIARYKTPARWHKAVQHLRELGKLEQSPRDIGHLIKETQEDIKKECAEEIAAYLTAHAMPQIMRGVVAGLPEFYKEELLRMQFEKDSGGAA